MIIPRIIKQLSNKINVVTIGTIYNLFIATVIFIKLRKTTKDSKEDLHK